MLVETIVEPRPRGHAAPFPHCGAARRRGARSTVPPAGGPASPQSAETLLKRCTMLYEERGAYTTTQDKRQAQPLLVALVDAYLACVSHLTGVSLHPQPPRALPISQ